MVALNNGVIQNKDGRSFDRSTGTWEEPNDETSNQNAEQKPSDAKTSNQNAEQKPSDAEQKQTDAEQKQTDAEQKPSDAKTKETPTKTPKPHIISYNIDGKYVRMSVDDLAHFKELRRQLASGIPLDDDLIRKMKPILAEAHLQDGTKIFNDKTKLSQLDNIMKHYQGKQISSLDDFLKLVLHTIR